MLREENFKPEIKEVSQEKESKIERLFISDFAKEIGLKADKEGRFYFQPEHVRLAYEYGEKFAREKKAERVVIDGIASPAVIAALLHGIHPAEGYLVYSYKDSEGKVVKTEVKILEPLPKNAGQGPEGFSWAKKETSKYTLVEFHLGKEFNVEDLKKVIPPEVDPTKPVIISGRGPLYLTQTIAAAYRHYKGIPGVGFYQPPSKFGPAKTEIGISHSEDLPLGLNFGEPEEIGIAKEQYEKKITESLHQIKEKIEAGKIRSIEIKGKTLRVISEDKEVYTLFVSDVIKGE